jgi:hypothetical protein
VNWTIPTKNQGNPKNAYIPSGCMVGILRERGFGRSGSGRREQNVHKYTNIHKQ